MQTITLENNKDFIKYRLGSGNTVEIFDIQVGTERGEGRGTMLIDQLKKIVREMNPPPHLIYAITREENQIARQFYAALGFRVVGFLHNFYIDGYGNAMLYGLTL